MPAGIVVEVPRPPRLTPELFEREYVRPARPVVFRGLVSDFGARKWDFPHVAPHFPSRRLRASGVAGGLRASWALTPSELVERLANESGRDGVRADWLFDVHDDLPELLPELPPPDVCSGDHQYRLFMGNRTVTPGHYHSFQHALICLIHGTKRVVLYAPEDSARLYPDPSTSDDRHYQSSLVDFAAPDFGRFPRALHARPVEVTLAPGDALFVPIHFWHAVYGEGPVLSTSLFWNARLRDYRFPQPGLTAMASVLRSHVSRGIEKLGSITAR